MRKIFLKSAALAFIGVSTLALQGCIEEVQPTGYASADQVESSSTAQEGLLRGLSAFMVKCNVYSSGSYALDNGYPSQMLTREALGQDMPVYKGGYDYLWFSDGSSLRYHPSFTYYYYYSLVNNANSIISALDTEGASTSAKASAGVAYTYRAMAYLDLARMFEYKKTGFSIDDKATDVLGLTVPIVTEKTSEEEAKNNPRAAFYTMYRFILTDLNKAEEYLSGYSRTGKDQPDQSVVYGLKARTWLELASRFEESSTDLSTQLSHESDNDGYDALGISTSNDCYAKAAEYAQKAMSGYTVGTKAEWYDAKTGFNTATNAWMWAAVLGTKEQLGSWYYSWMGFMNSEASGFSMGRYGGAYRCIDASLYKKIGASDWRKKTWVAPEDAGKASIPEGYATSIANSEWADLPEYANLKFHAGQGNLTNYQVGELCDIPLMRVEEMYFTYFEAIAHTQGVGAAKSALESFMNAYRYDDGSYTCSASSVSDLTEEILLQKRIELWGEGVTFFDYKRLRHAITRTYEGSNYLSSHRLNSKAGYVAPWMNYYIPEEEKNSNPAIVLNPDPSGVVTYVE